MMWASQAILRRVAAATGPVKAKFPVPVLLRVGMSVRVSVPFPLLLPARKKSPR
jgi:hypothetical protein